MFIIDGVPRKKYDLIYHIRSAADRQKVVENKIKICDNEGIGTVCGFRSSRTKDDRVIVRTVESPVFAALLADWQCRISEVVKKVLTAIDNLGDDVENRSLPRSTSIRLGSVSVEKKLKTSL